MNASTLKHLNSLKGSNRERYFEFRKRLALVRRAKIEGRDLPRFSFLVGVTS